MVNTNQTTCLKFSKLQQQEFPHKLNQHPENPHNSHTNLDQTNQEIREAVTSTSP